VYHVVNYTEKPTRIAILTPRHKGKSSSCMNEKPGVPNLPGIRVISDPAPRRGRERWGPDHRR